MIDEKKKEEFARRYAEEKRLEQEGAAPGTLYRRSLARRRRRRRARIRQITRIAAAFGVLILIIVCVTLLIKGIVGKMSDESDETVKASAEVPTTAGVQVTIAPTEAPASADGEDDSDEDALPEEAKPDELVEIPEKADYRGLVIVDAGHGGNDGGACYKDAIEKELNLAVAFLLKDELEKYGYSVYMTREDDTFVGIRKRAALANEQADAKLFVSIHMNAVEEEEGVNGIELWSYDRSGSRELAAHLLSQTCAATGALDRGVNYSKGLVVIRDTKVPACLVECGYLTNDKERELLKSEEYQKKLVYGIVAGIDLFLSGK